MTLLTAVMGAGLVFWFWPRAGITADVTSSPVRANAQVHGAELFQANCASCHGATGQGHLFPAAPALDGSEHAWHHPDEQIVALIRQGGRLMPAVGNGWSDEDVEAVLAYVKQWWTPEQRKAQRGTIGE